MRTHLLQVAGRLLVPLIFVGCQEASTDPQGAGIDQTSSPPMNPAISSTANRPTIARFTADSDFGEVVWTNNGFAFSAGFVSVSRTSTGVFLFYEFRASGDACFEGECPVYQGGYGEIPASDLTLSGRTVNGRKLSVLKLSTNTANDPNVYVYAGSVARSPWNGTEHRDLSPYRLVIQ